MLRIVALCETGTRSLLGAVFGPVDVSENAYAEQLLPLLNDDMPSGGCRVAAVGLRRGRGGVAGVELGAALTDRPYGERGNRLGRPTHPASSRAADRSVADRRPWCGTEVS
jgi:hypothetical protein